MNYLAHGWRFIHDPYVLAGTAVPDWLSVADRAVRVRSQRAAIWMEHPNPVLSAVSRGICQHHTDDNRFHASPPFAELSLDFAARVRRSFPSGEGLRSWFLGHILVELLLDASLVEDDPGRTATYYAALAEAEPRAIENAVNAFALRPTKSLSRFIALFCRERFLWDYLDDAKLLMRLNQVMWRARLPQLPRSFVELFPDMRVAVRDRRCELLDPPTVTENLHEIRNESAAVDR